jgi:hypothetical protein
MEDGEKGGQGAQSYDGEKAWSSIDHLILSGRSTQSVRAYTLQCIDAESKDNMVYGTITSPTHVYSLAWLVLRPKSNKNKL